MDLEPLRQSRDFRLLFLGQMVNMLGNQLTVVAIPFPGLRAHAVVPPSRSRQFGAGCPIGSRRAAGRFDRKRHGPPHGHAHNVPRRSRRRAGPWLSTRVSAIPPSWLIYVACALGAGAGGMYSTACSSVAPSLVAPERLLAAFATMQVVDQVGMVGGPALSGVLLEVVHLQLGVRSRCHEQRHRLRSSVACMASLPPAPGAAVDRRRPSLREGARRDPQATMYSWVRISSTSTPWCSGRPAPSSPH